MNVKRSTPVGEKNIVLIGFMGVGKTTIGKLAPKNCAAILLILTKKLKKTFR